MATIIATKKTLSECLEIANNGMFKTVGMDFRTGLDLARVRWKRSFQNWIDFSIPEGWLGLEMEKEDVVRVFTLTFDRILNNPVLDADAQFVMNWIRELRKQAEN